MYREWVVHFGSRQVELGEWMGRACQPNGDVTYFNVQQARMIENYENYEKSKRDGLCESKIWLGLSLSFLFFFFRFFRFLLIENRELKKPRYSV